MQPFWQAVSLKSSNERKLGTWLLSGKLQLCPAGDGADADAAGNAADTADKEGTRGTHFLHSRGSQVVTVQYLGDHSSQPSVRVPSSAALCQPG